MSRVPLLNSTDEMMVAKHMVDTVAGKLEAVERELSRTVMDRDTYLQRISRAIVLREVLSELHATYSRAIQR